MQTWEMQLDALTTSQCIDLYTYLWNCDVEHYDVKQRILHGKKKHLFKLIDKDAFKTMRRLYRHQERAIDTTIYPVEQLLEVGIAREVTIEGFPQYELHPQAIPFVKSIMHARHFDEYLKSWQLRDYLLMGIMHTYGMLEVEHLCVLLKNYDIVVEAQEVMQSVRWRLSIRNQLQIYNKQKGKQAQSYIALKNCDFEKLYKLRKSNSDIFRKTYTYEDMIDRKDRYYALENSEVQDFMKELRTRFSQQFVETSAKEMIDVYVYHFGSFTHYDMIIRVLNKEKIDTLKERAIASFDMIY